MNSRPTEDFRAPHATQRGAGIGADIKRIVPLLLLLYTFLLPQEIRISVASQTIYPYRAMLIVLLPWLLQKLIMDRHEWRMADILAFLACGWVIVSFVAYYGVGEGLTRGGALVLDTLGAYLVARISIQGPTDLRRLLVFFAPGVFLAALSIMAESVSHHFIVRPFFASIFGPLPVYVNGEATGATNDFVVYRLGLLRAPGPFSQPILAGVFLSTMLPFYALSGLRRWPLWLGILAAFGAIFSVSSAAILGLILGIGLLGYDEAQRRTTFLNWKQFLAAVVAFMLLIQFASNGGLVNILIRFTLDPQTGQFRLLIWDYGMRSVYAHPWFGIGYTDYQRLPWMVASIDAHWLALAVRHGFIMPISLLASLIVVTVQLARIAPMLGEADRRLYVGTAIALVVLLILGFTVSYFGSVGLWLYVVMAIAASLVTAVKPVPPPSAATRFQARQNLILPRSA